MKIGYEEKTGSKKKGEKEKNVNLRIGGEGKNDRFNCI